MLPIRWRHTLSIFRSCSLLSKSLDAALFELNNSLITAVIRSNKCLLLKCDIVIYHKLGKTVQMAISLNYLSRTYWASC